MNTRKGFTLVELLVVIAILAILATVSVVGYTAFINRANDSVAVSELTQIRDYAISMDVVSPTGDFDGEVDEAEALAAIANAEATSKVTWNADKTVVTYTVNGGSATWTLATGAIAPVQD